MVSDSVTQLPKGKKGLIRYLCTEVEHNMADLEKFWDGRNNITGDLERLKSKLEDGLIPLAIVSDHTVVYYGNITELHQLKDSTIKLLLLYYGSLGKIRALSEGFVLPSFKTISIEGKITVIKEPFEECGRCMDYGNCVLKELKNNYFQ